MTITNNTQEIASATVELKLTTIEEYVALIPPLYISNYEALKSSIKEDGQFAPIVVNQDLGILDGYHRYKACQELGITPKITIMKFKNRLQEKRFIIESNRNRRHLNEFQRIELQFKLESIDSEIANERMSGLGERGTEK